MKKPSDDLFKLIKSLTKSEKRAFRLNAASGNETKKYSAIFDAMDAQKNYDEEALKIKFKNEKWVTRFNAAKHYVYQVLLNNLSVYNQQHEPSYQLADLIVHIKVLQGKGFYIRCQKLIDKGKVIAKEIDDKTKILELFNLESINHPGGVNPEKITEIRAEQIEVLKLLENEFLFDELYKKSYRIFSKTGYEGFDAQDNEKYDELMKSDLFLNNNTALTFNSKRKFININYFRAVGNDNRKQMEYWVFKAKELFENQPQFIELQALNYSTTLLNLHNYFLKQHEFDKALDIIGELRTFYPKEKLKRQERLTYIIEYGALHNEISTLNTMGDFTNSLDKLTELEKSFNKHKQEISLEIVIRHLYLVAMTNFGAGRFKQCRNILEEIFKKTNLGIRKDLIKRSKILLFLVYFELGKIDLLEYKARSVKRFLQKNGEYTKLEEHLFKLINHLSDSFFDKVGVRKELAELYEIKNSARYVPDYEEILFWVESKLEKISFADFVMKNKRITER